MISKQNGNPNPTPYQTLESAQPSIASIYHTKTYKNCQCSSSLPPGGFQKCGLHWSAITYFQHSEFWYILFCLCHKNDTTKKTNRNCKQNMQSNSFHQTCHTWFNLRNIGWSGHPFPFSTLKPLLTSVVICWNSASWQGVPEMRTKGQAIHRQKTCLKGLTFPIRSI